jgi:hypothetical protein
MGNNPTTSKPSIFGSGSARFRRDLRARRAIRVELPEFLVCALEVMVAQANDGAAADERCTLDHYIESELVNLVTLRDVAELEEQLPGFSDAVHEWVLETSE